MSFDWSSFSLQDFVESRSFHLAEPYEKNGFRYATDRCILVAVPAVGSSPGAENFLVKFPDVEKVLSQASSCKNWNDWDVTVLPCSCNKRKIVCDDCSGKGHILCNLGHDHECDECDGDGWVYCQTCTGIEHAIDIGEVKVSTHYARLISELPQPIRWAVGKTKDLLHFTFCNGVGRGAVAGMKQ